MLAKPWEIFQNSFIDGLKPDPLMTVSEWSEDRRYLSQTASAEPGKWRNSRTPYSIEIMDCLSPASPVQEIVAMKGAQIGFTELGNNWIGFTMDIDPAPMLGVSPNLEMAKRNSKQRITPLINECPSIRKKVKENKSRDSSNTTLSKDFPGGTLILTGANSASGLRSMPAKKIFLDEVDAYPKDVDGEGNPVDLAKARSRTYANRKIFMLSTPTVESESIIEPEYLDSDQRYYYMPCPFCKEPFKYTWSQMRWEKNKPDSVYQECPHCRGKVKEHYKTAMMAQGEWVPENKNFNNPRKRGYHLSSLYSPLGWFSWSDAVREWIKAKKSQAKLKSFINTILGETWKEKTEVPDWKRLYRRREGLKPGKVPHGGLFVTCGVDVQKDRIEALSVAWGRGKESWMIDHQVFLGDTSSIDNAPWLELDDFLHTTYTTSNGQELNISKLAVDSSAYTQTVYEWARQYSIKNIIAIKGNPNLKVALAPPSKVDINHKGKKIKRGMQMFNVGVDLIKTEIYGWLNLEPPLKEGDPYPSGFVHFPEWPDEFFLQLTAERIVHKTMNGYVKYQWEKTRERNEALDMFVYARAAATYYGIDRMKEEKWKELEASLGVVSEIQKPEKDREPFSQKNPSEKTNLQKSRKERRVRKGRRSRKSRW